MDHRVKKNPLNVQIHMKLDKPTSDLLDRMRISLGVRYKTDVIRIAVKRLADREGIGS
jgi:hypothetical protein